MTTPQKFRKKPLEVEAMQWDGSNLAEAQQFAGFRLVDPGAGHWMVNFLVAKEMFPHAEASITGALWVAANKGWLGMKTGDWIIKDRLGCYPCEASVFTETYEPASTFTLPQANVPGARGGQITQIAPNKKVSS